MDRDGVGLIEDLDNGRCYMFSPKVVKGAESAPRRQLGIRNGKVVRFALRPVDQRQIDWVDAQWRKAA